MPGRKLSEILRDVDQPKPIEVPEGPQLIQFESGVDREYSTFTQFLQTGVDLTSHLWDSVLGGDYKRQSNSTFAHKLTIIKYVSLKNNLDGQRLYKEMRKNNTEEQKTQQIHELNRVNLIAEIAECRNRIGMTAYAWGTAIGAFPMMLNISIWRKLAATLTIIHLAGSYANYRNIDRIYDKVEPFFKQDWEIYKKQPQSPVGQLKTDKLDKILENKRLDQYMKEYQKSIN